MRYSFWLLFAAASCLISCDRKAPVPPAAPPAPTTLPAIEPAPSLATLDRGARLFQENCAQCHGPEGEGHPDWRTPGVVAAPPLNGTGDDWKRSRAELLAVIANGATRNGVPVMPGWKGRLKDDEISDIVAWFQALWPPEVYARWQRANGTRTGG